MRKISYLFTIAVMSFAAILSFTVVSCGDDEDEINDYGKDGDNESTQVDTTVVQTSYRDPIITWGASKSQVKNYMNDYELYDEDSGYLIYYGKDIEEAYYYYFEDSELCISEVDIDTTKINKSTLQKKLTSTGYTFVENKDSVEYYISSDYKTFAFISTSKYYGLYELTYIDYEWLMEEDESSEPADYFLPYTVWGASKSHVKNYMNDYDIYEEEEDYIIYYGTGITDCYYYEFDNSELFVSEVDINMDEVSKGSIISKLENDGYEYVEAEDTTEYYISSDEKTVVYLNASKYWGVYEVIYICYEWLETDGDSNVKEFIKRRNSARVRKHARLNNNIAAKRDNAIIRLRRR